MRKTLMMSAAVSSIRWLRRIRFAGCAGSSSAAPRTSGIIVTPVSKPDRPRASLGKTSSAIPTTIHGLLLCDVSSAEPQSPMTWPCEKTLTAAVAMTTRLRPR